MKQEHAAEQEVRYEPDERLRPALALGLAVQHAALSLASMIVTILIVVRSAGLEDSYLSWAVFAGLIVSGLTTMLQTTRRRRLGSGHLLLMGPAAAYIAVSITALSEGGPTLLATLVLISALPLLRVARRLRRLRRILTPTVSSTIIMLIPVTLAPVIFDLFGQTPAGTPPVAAPLTAGVTLAAIMVVTLRTRGVARVWAPVIGVLAGCVVGALFGTYDVQRVMESHWIGLPRFSAWPGLDFSALGRHFWLLPSFMFLSLAGAVETVGNAIAVQKVSWRRPRATDYTLVQNAVATDGVGNLLSGLAGTLPTTTYSTSVGIAEITGVAARRVGVFVGLLFGVLAFFPKVVSLLLAIPNAVAGAFTLALAAVLFTLGIKLVVASGLDYRKGAIVGISFWVGVGFQNGWLFPELLDQAGGRLGVLLGNGMTAGGIMAIVLSLILDPPGQWKRRTMELNTEAIPAVDEFVVALASRRGWSEAAMTPLRAACEEVILSLKEEEDPFADDPEFASERSQQLRVSARIGRESGELEFVAAFGSGNLEDEMATLGEPDASTAGEETSLRLLRHYASSIRHQKYRKAEVVTITVKRRG